jgi:hypothetical protein
MIALLKLEHLETTMAPRSATLKALSTAPTSDLAEQVLNHTPEQVAALLSELCTYYALSQTVRDALPDLA